MLITEVSTSRGVKESEAVDLLSRALWKSALKWPEPL
jgi:hypothetical protein